MTQFIIIYGNVVDGLKFIGPFSDHESALEYAENDLLEEFNIAKLQNPGD